MNILELLKNFNAYSGWGIVAMIIVLIGISLYAYKINNNNIGHRYSSIEDNEKEMKKFASEFVTKHKDEFIRKHHTHFYRAILTGARWERDKKK